MPVFTNTPRAWLAALALIVAAAPASAQVLRVTATNAVDSRVYDVKFSGSGGTTTTLNTDQTAHSSFHSDVYVINADSGKIDLLVADTVRGEIVRYADATGASTLLWSTAQGAGPRHPDGLSVDAAGNLYVLSSGKHDQEDDDRDHDDDDSPTQVWVLPRDPARPTGAAFLAPRLIDGSFGGAPVHYLEDTLVSRTTRAAAGPGDLLVLSSSPTSVFVYSAASIAAVIAGGGPVSPSRTLLGPSDFPVGNSLARGMDFWPVNDSLLIATSKGTILAYAFTATTPTRLADFASGLGTGKFKIRIGLDGGIPYAFVADYKGNRILKFGAPPATGSNPPLASVTDGVRRPQGLTTSNLASVGASTCLQSAGGCDPLGNVIAHSVQNLSTLAGFVIEEPCVVRTDPRVTQYGTCTGHTLPVAQVCSGFGATVIPDYLCGGAGPSGAGFALVKSTTNTLAAAKGALVLNEVFTGNVLPGTSPDCPQTVVGWAPTEGEGTVVEGNALLELTGGCGSSKSLSKGLSLWGAGLVLNEPALPGTDLADKRVKFALSKYDTLSATVAAATITSTFRNKLNYCLAKSRGYFMYHKYLNAAGQLVTCDALVAANEAAFTATTNNPNPSGEIRSRIANLYLQIYARILGNPAPTSWPISP